MNIIFLSRRKAKARHLNLARPLTLSVLGALTLMILGGVFALGMQLGRGSHGGGVRGDPVRFGSLLTEQKQQLAELRQQLQLRVDAMAMRLGAVNANVIRPNALGKRLTPTAR